VEEQEMLKKQFLEAGEKLVADDDGGDDDDNDEDGFLKLRSKSKAEREKEEKEDEEFWKAEEKRTGKKQGSGDDVLSSFWLGGDLDENEKFLRKYALLFYFILFIIYLFPSFLFSYFLNYIIYLTCVCWAATF
jgi:hypothetical protein